MKSMPESFIRPAASDGGRRGRRFCRSEAGGALIELAMVCAFILSPIFLGLVELSKAYHYSIEVNEAASAGAEYGARSSGGYTDLTDMQTAASNEAQDITMATGYPKADYRVCTDTNGTPSACVTCTSPSSCIWPAAPNSVFVDVSTKATLNLLVTNVPLTFTGYATMRAQ